MRRQRDAHAGGALDRVGKLRRMGGAERDGRRRWRDRDQPARRADADGAVRIDDEGAVAVDPPHLRRAGRFVDALGGEVGPNALEGRSGNHISAAFGEIGHQRPNRVRALV